MKCPQCGKPVTRKQAFCSACGADAPEFPPKKPFPVVIVLSIVLALSLVTNVVLLCIQKPSQNNGSLQGYSQQMEGEGFSSPEAAITAYAEALRDGDLDKMVSTYAIESYVECFDLENYIRKCPSFPFHSNLPLQSKNSNAFVVEYNKYARLACFTYDVRTAYYELTGINSSYGPNYHFFGDEEELHALLDQLAAPGLKQKLSQIKIGNVLTRDDFTFRQNGEYYDRQLDAMRSYLKGAELCDVAIEIDFDGEQYYLFMLTGKIDGKWYNIQTPGPLYSFVLDLSTLDNERIFFPR